MAATAGSEAANARERLKGGYQLLQTLVAIRLRSVTDPESVRHLTWLSDIIAALSLLNRRMADGAAVDFGGYLEDAAAFWRRNCEGRPIRLQVRGTVEALPDSHALPMAIILHELVGNAVRHAFPGDIGGSIAVAFSRAADGISLVVRDSGVGLDQSTLRQGEGLALVEGLVQHLGGAMSVEAAPGSGVGVRIRLPLGGAATH